ncbi:hypothetical protein ACIB24_14155 [Spongisporangium articulatum]|uniref:Uncharacterized protein n=1 Tax=Spongisporangium articulatum TaxID=3362603 RepID=A0ABW8APA1_9ACTN
MSQPTSDQPTSELPSIDPSTDPSTAPPPAETVVPPTHSAIVEPVTRPLRMRTVVLGVILLAIATLSLIDTTTSMNVDLGTTVLALMIGCGVLLIVGARRD